MSNCTSPNPCQTDSGSVIYTSGNLSCIDANTNDSLSFILFKLNQKICDLQEQLDECCSTSTSTTTTTTTTIAICINPIVTMLNNNDDVGNFLDEGSIEPICDNCCPDCGNFYIFGSVQTFLQIYEAFPVVISESPCCTNTCNLQFEEYVGSVNYINLLDKGFVEYSTVGGKSMLCYLLDYAEQNSLTATQLYDLTVTLLDKGVVVYCNNGTQLVASREKFSQYLEVTGDQPLEDECCISVVTSVTRYLQYIEVVNDPTPPPPIP